MNNQSNFNCSGYRHMAETDVIDDGVCNDVSSDNCESKSTGRKYDWVICDSRLVNPGLIDGENLKQYSKNQIRRRGQICVERFLKKVPPFHVVSMITDNKDSLPGLIYVLYCTIMYCTEEYGKVK